MYSNEEIHTVDFEKGGTTESSVNISYFRVFKYNNIFPCHLINIYTVPR